MQSLQPYAADVFLRQYTNRTVVIKEPYRRSDLHTILISGDIIHIFDYDVAVSVLKYFGTYISKLEFDYLYDIKHQLKHMIRLANKHCDNLTYLYLGTHVEDAFEVIDRPFSNVIDLSLLGKFKRIGNESFTMNEMFPKLQNLTLNSFDDSVVDLDVHFPHLISLDIEFSSNGPFYNEIKKLIKKNPQIRYLRLNYIYSSFIDFVSKNLENLESLNIPKIKWVDFTDEIHFKNVKKFEIDYVVGRLNLTFEEIEEFHCDPSKFVNWLDFAEKHKKLKKLFLKGGGYITNEDLWILAENVHHLTEASFECNSFVELKNLVKFLENSKNLEKLHLSHYTCSKTRINALMNLIENDWTYVKDKQEYVIVRKN